MQAASLGSIDDQQSFEQAVCDFHRMLDLDPPFADARVWLAITYLCLEGFGFVPPAIAFEQARHLAEVWRDRHEPCSGCVARRALTLSADV
jgi:hypothetical protein